jgi:hypothetical protein
MGNVHVKSGSVTDIYRAAGDGTGGWVYKDSPWSAVSATITGTGAVSTFVTVQVSNDGVTPLSTSLGTITLSGTGAAADGFVTGATPWKYVRAVVSTTGGVGTTVVVSIGS